MDADAAGQNIATAQQWFPTLGAIAVEANTTYEMDGQLVTTRTAGVTSHTTGLIFAGTGTLIGIQYEVQVNSGDDESVIAQNRTISRTAANTTVKGASTSATESVSIFLEGIVRINAAGTFIPQFIYSATPGGAPTIRANSYFQLRKRGSGTLTAIGTWT